MMRTRRVLPMMLAVTLVSLGCTRIIDTPHPVRAWPVAPITAGQISDLLSRNAKPEAESNLFLTVDPPQCAAMASEVDPPFLFDIGTTPAARSAGQWFADGPRTQYSIQEMAVVYPANFDSQAAMRDVRRTIETCRDESLTVVTTDDDTLHFQLVPQAESGAPEIALWSLSGGQRSCDNAYIAAYNAAIEITACGDHNGYHVVELAEQALTRLHALANMTS